MAFVLCKPIRLRSWGGAEKARLGIAGTLRTAALHALHAHRRHSQAGQHIDQRQDRRQSEPKGPENDCADSEDHACRDQPLIPDRPAHGACAALLHWAFGDRKSTRLTSSHLCASSMPSSTCKKKKENKRR